jgi:serine/threonine-protein kinase
MKRAEDIGYAESTPSTMGRYTIVGHLASGGMAEILLGKTIGLAGFERPVVIKRILPHLARQRSIVNMFLDEARIVSKINHPNVVQVHELAMEGDELFQVFEYLEGESAIGLLRRLTSLNRIIDLDLAAFIVSEVLAGLSAAHTLCDASGAPLNIVHRDISPENIFVTYRGTTKLLDFGVARMEDRLTRTRTGETKGKFAYMSPEQVRGESLDARSDLFAVGVVLYELSTGTRLFRQDSAAATVEAVLRQPIPSPVRPDRAYPPALAQICARALARDLADRYQSAEEMRDDLLAYLRDHEQSERGVPLTDALGALMQELFVERIEEKHELLRRLSFSNTPLTMPEVEVDTTVEIPAATIPEVRLQSPRAGDPNKRVVRTRTLVLGSALLLAITGFVAGTRFNNRAPTPTLVRAPVPEPGPVTPVPSVPAIVQVHIAVHTQPPGARLRFDGVDRGVTPLVLDVPREEAEASVELWKPGFLPIVRTIARSRDTDLEVTLERTPTVRKAGPSRARPAVRHPAFEKL